MIEDFFIQKEEYENSLFPPSECLIHVVVRPFYINFGYTNEMCSKLIHSERHFKIFYPDITAAQLAILELDWVGVVCGDNDAATRLIIFEEKSTGGIGRSQLIDAYRNISIYPGSFSFSLNLPEAKKQSVINSIRGSGNYEYQIPAVSCKNLPETPSYVNEDCLLGEISNFLKILFIGRACLYSLKHFEKMIEPVKRQRWSKRLKQLLMLMDVSCEREGYVKIDEKFKVRSIQGSHRLLVLVGVYHAVYELKEWTKGIEIPHSEVIVISSSLQKSKETCDLIYKTLDEKYKDKSVEKRYPSKKRSLVIEQYLDALNGLKGDFDICFFLEIRKDVISEIMKRILENREILPGLSIKKVWCATPRISSPNISGKGGEINVNLELVQVWPSIFPQEI